MADDLEIIIDDDPTVPPYPGTITGNDLSKIVEDEKRRAKDERAARTTAEHRATDADRRSQETYTRWIDAERRAIDAEEAAAVAEAESSIKEYARFLDEDDSTKAAEASVKASTARFRAEEIGRRREALNAYEKRVKEGGGAPPNGQGGSEGIDPKLKAWIDDHPAFNTDPRFRARAIATHYDALHDGHAEYSDGYFEYIDQHLDGGGQPRQARGREEPPTDEPAPRPRRESAPPPAAPASRGGTGGGPGADPRRITLTAEQREVAMDAFRFLRNAKGEPASDAEKLTAYVSSQQRLKKEGRL